MNKKLRNSIAELESSVINDEKNKYIILDLINNIKINLNKCVIIPKNNLHFIFTVTKEKSPIDTDKELGHIKCEINTPKIVRSYIVDKNLKENESEFIEYYKEILKNILINDWSKEENE